jgi:hypothetical protein
MRWEISHRCDRRVRPLADRHYNRQSVGAPNFVPPGRCLVLKMKEGETTKAFWVTSWPFAQYVKHAWAGAWVNSAFRKECPGDASEMIRSAVAATRSVWSPPALGLVTFVDPKHVKPTVRRGMAIYGYCYLKAGFRRAVCPEHNWSADRVGPPRDCNACRSVTEAGLWAWQMPPAEMPCPRPILNGQLALFV